MPEKKHAFTVVTYCHETGEGGVYHVKATTVKRAIKDWADEGGCCSVAAVFEGWHTSVEGEAE